MSTELAITAVTLALQSVLRKGVVDDQTASDLAELIGLQKGRAVTALAPQKVRGSDEHKDDNVVNLYLYRTEVNAAWRNHSVPSVTHAGEVGPPPLALNLDYLVTAFGESDKEIATHLLMGLAMRALHDRGVIPRRKLKDVLEEANVHEQIESVTVSPRPMSVDEMSKLWTILGTHYHLSAGYLVTVVLIDSRLPTSSALPVLRRGEDDRAPVAVTSRPPEIKSLVADSKFPSVRLGEKLIILGERLDGGGISARLSHRLFTDPRTLPLAVTVESATRAAVVIPDVPATGPAGTYMLSLVVERPPLAPSPTEAKPFTLAPTISLLPLNVDTPETDFDVTITVKPEIRLTQEVIVLWDDRQIAPKSATATTIVFTANDVAGSHRVRLRVDGVDSIPAVRVDGQFQFAADQTVEIDEP